MLERHLAIVIFGSKDSVLLQDRRKVSKAGETVGFFGGTIEQGETDEQAIKRELREELDYTPGEIHHLLTTPGHLFKLASGKKLNVISHVFVSPITEELLAKNVLDGSGKMLIKLEDAVNLSGLDTVGKWILNKYRHSTYEKN